MIGVMGVLMLVVFVHELGHYLVARWFSVNASVFSIGFGPEIRSFMDRHGTCWRVALIPLGGYVKFVGEEDRLSFLDDKRKDKLVGSFCAATAWKRAFIVFAGPCFNFLFTLFVFSIVFFTVGRTVTAPIVKDVIPNLPAFQAGLKSGDRFLSIEDRSVSSFEDLSRYVMLHGDDPIHFTVMRDGKRIDMVVTPLLKREDGLRIGHIGILAQKNLNKIHYNVLDSVRYALDETLYTLNQTWYLMIRLLQGKGDRCQLSGPVQSIEIAWKISRLGFGALLQLAAYFSMSIGVFNLLPIPSLDGGHLVFYLLEGILGRQFSVSFQKKIVRIGLIFIILLMIFTIINNYIPC
jgi:regulator of sigma E protease